MAVDVESGLARCVVEVSGHTLGVVVVERDTATFFASSPVAAPEDGREFRSLPAALATLRPHFAQRLATARRARAA